MHEGGREFDEIYDLTAVRVLDQLRSATATARSACPLAVEAGARPLQGLHRDAQGQHVPVAAHDGDRAQGRPDGDPDPHLRDAPHRRGGHRGPLALQGEEERPGPVRRRASPGCASCWNRSRTRTTPRSSSTPSASTSSPTRSTSSRPKGDVKALPEGSTPIDFAYAVHTDVGHHCVGAKVNGKLVPLRYTLRQGDIVEIVTSPNQHPSRDWLKIVKSTARALQDQPVAQGRGARPLARARPRAVRARGQEVPAGPRRRCSRRDEMKKLARRARLPDGRRPAGLDRLRQDLASHQVLGKLAPAAVLRAAEQRPRARPTRGRAPSRAVRIRGVDDLLVRFAKCCSPVPGDGIVGFITRGRGLTVHARDCLTVVKNVLDKRAAHQRGVGRGGAGQAPGPDRRLHRARPPGPARRDHRRHLLPRTATSPRPRSPSPTTAGASTTSWSRSTTCASSRRSWARSARLRTSSTSSASAVCESGADDSGPSATFSRRGSRRPPPKPPHRWRGQSPRSNMRFGAYLGRSGATPPAAPI